MRRRNMLLALALTLLLAAGVISFLSARDPFIVACNCIRIGMTKARVEELMQPFPAPPHVIDESPDLIYSSPADFGESATPLRILGGTNNDLPKLLNLAGGNFRCWEHNKHFLQVGYGKDDCVCYALMDSTPSFWDTARAWIRTHLGF